MSGPIKNVSTVLGVSLIFLGIFWVQKLYPAATGSNWDAPVEFRFDSEACEDRRLEREYVDYRHSDEEEPISVADLAEDYNLETARVCAENGWPRDCSRQMVQPGETLTLPLSLSRPSTGPRRLNTGLPKSVSPEPEGASSSGAPAIRGPGSRAAESENTGSGGDS